MPADRSFTWNVDLAGPIDRVPVLFYAIRSPCACGRSLDECVYTFFPTAVFVHGVCRECGPQSAIFAPTATRCPEEPLPAAIARMMEDLTRHLARAYGANPAIVLDEFLNYLAAIDDAAHASGTNPAT